MPERNKLPKPTAADWVLMGLAVLIACVVVQILVVGS